MSEVNLDTLGISVAELQNYNTVDLSQLVETLLEGKSESERTAILDAIRSELAAAIVEYEDMIEGAKDDEDRARDMDDDMGEMRAEEEQDELDEMIDFLEDDAETMINDAEVAYLKTHYSTSEDLKLTTSEFEDGDTVIIESTANLEEVFEDTSDQYVKGTDYNDDGIVNYADYELFVQDQKTAMYGNYQDIFLTLDPGYTVTHTEYSDDKVAYTVSNGEKTITYAINNISDGVHIFFDSTEENFISESTYKSWPAALQKMTFFGASLNSIYENLHPATDAAKLEYVSGYVETSDAIESMATEFGSSDPETVSERVSEYVDMLMGYYNMESGTTTIEDIWADIYTKMADLSNSVQSEILATLIYTFASANDQATTVAMFTGQASKIEDILFQDGGLTENEMVSVMFLESFVATGYYGGGEQFWSSPLLSAGSMGSVFYTNDAGGIELNPESEYAQYFADVDATIAAMQSFKDSLKYVSWASDNGIVQTTIDRLEEMKTEEESGTTDVVTDEDFETASNMSSIVADNCTVVTDQEFYRVSLGTLFDYFTSGKSVETLASDIRKFFNSMTHDHRDDIAADFVCHLKKYMPDLFKSLCGVSGWANAMEEYILDGWDKPENADKAVGYLN